MPDEDEEGERFVDRAFTITMLIAGALLLAVGIRALVVNDWWQAATCLLGVLVTGWLVRRGRRGARSRGR